MRIGVVMMATGTLVAEVIRRLGVSEKTLTRLYNVPEALRPDNGQGRPLTAPESDIHYGGLVTLLR